MIGCGRQQLIGLKKDKSEIHIDLEVVDFIFDNQIFFRGIIRDITSIKQIELDLLNSEAKARAILDTTIDSIISINTCGLIELFNPAAERLFEYTPNEVIGKNVKMLMSHPHSDNHDEYIGCFLRTGIKKIIGYGREVVGKKKSGALFDMELSISEVFLHDKKIFTATIRDITKRIQDKKELEMSKKELEQALMIKNNFLAKMSHELRTPMNGILGMSNILLNMDLTAEQTDMVTTIIESGEILLNVVNDILDFSKIAAEKLELEYVNFNLQVLIEQVIDMMIGQARLKKLDLSFLIPNDIPIFLIGDPLKIRQILTNIINNAIKFTNTGHIFVSLKLLNTFDMKIDLLIEVIDTGIGILDTDLPRLFKPFTQVDETTTRKYEGSGLGLVIAKQLAISMNGDIKISSVFNKGSIFSITLQLDKQLDKQSDKQLDKQLDKHNIIVITKFKSTSQIFKYYFKYLGVACIFCKNLNDIYDKLSNYTHLICEFNNTLLEKLDEVSVKFTNLKIIGIKYINQQYKNIPCITYWVNKPLKKDAIYSIFNDENFIKKRKLSPIIKENKSFKKGIILVAEDNLINQKVVLCIIKKHGYIADVASNGIEVIELLKKTKYSLIFMDCHMPEMDGFECTKLIRLSEKNTKSHIKIIALTGGVSVNDKQKCIDCGMDGFLSKPVRSDDICKIIKELPICNNY
jgi:PAS domain S-box-containing protein